MAFLSIWQALGRLSEPQGDDCPRLPRGWLAFVALSRGPRCAGARAGAGQLQVSLLVGVQGVTGWWPSSLRNHHPPRLGGQSLLCLSEAASVNVFWPRPVSLRWGSFGGGFGVCVLGWVWGRSWDVCS